MRINFRLFLLIATIFSITSCMTVKQYEKSYMTEKRQGLENPGEVFVMLKNGNKIVGKEITFSKSSIWRIKQKENWIAVDGQKIETENIIAYQTKDEYFKLFRTGEGRLVNEFFIPRVRHGKIDLYYYTTTHEYGPDEARIKTSQNMYLFEKEHGGLQYFSADKFYEAIRDNAAAVQMFNVQFPKGKVSMKDDAKRLRKIAAVVDAYNG